MTHLLFLILALAGSSFPSKKLTADPQTSFIRYRMEHPLHNWDATSRAARCVVVYDERITAVAVSAPVKSFDSGNSNRDSHALEALEALTYKNVTFSSSEISENNEKLTIKGNLTFHGVTRPIVFYATRKKEAAALRVEGAFAINMTDYGINPPSLMGIKTKENIAIDFLMVFSLE